jgi:hypothetical protein
MPAFFTLGRHPRPFPRQRRFRAIGYANVVSVYPGTLPQPSLGYIDVISNNVGGDHNEVWRYTSGTTAIRITKTLPINGTFRDYAVASGVTYFYFVRAVNADGSYFESSVTSASVTLADPWIFAVTKGASTNLSGIAYTLKAVEPQSRPVSRVEQVLRAPTRTKPIIATGEIVTKSWAVAVVSPNLSVSDVVTLETLATLNQTLCIRDTYGRLMFGTISDMPIAYGITSVVSLTLQETDYHEQVA